ncbi:Acg family FMN-binding oxidoreductase [Hungatella effluvii]|uniref:Acg family FMN-binding oxidoreductase n=1 Tax=Hungatella effluvii TaxID=1096246 RepID=UPI002A806152|nr:hypothetical protein [Hungatella effluvii]
MRRKGVKTFLIVAVIIFLGGAITLYLFGKPAKVNTDTHLNGVTEDIENALYYASFAANSHNTQSWKVELDIAKQQLTIFPDEERALDFVDPKHRELYISLGCYIESITFAFDAYGYDTTLEYAEPIGLNNEIATISYSRRENAEINNRQIETLKRRHTDKRSYNTDRINAEVIAQLLKDTDGIYCYETGTEEFEYLKNGTMEAISKQSAEAAYRTELNQWMRFSNKEAEQKKDGISAEMIGLNGIIKAFYYMTTNHKNAENDTFAAQGIDTAKKQTENCSVFFVITGNDTVIDWIEAGRKTQAFGYRCVENNLSIQPLSAMLEVVPYSEDIQSQLDLAKNVQMILRAGYVKDYGENAGVRRNLEDYITVINGN